MERFRILKEQIKAIEQTRLERLQRDPAEKFNAMVFLIARVNGLGVETAYQLVHEILSRNLRDRKAVARYAGLTGSPDESGSKRREKGSCVRQVQQNWAMAFLTCLLKLPSFLVRPQETVSSSRPR